jgi:hypothetical protein
MPQTFQLLSAFSHETNCQVNHRHHDSDVVLFAEPAAIPSSNPEIRGGAFILRQALLLGEISVAVDASRPIG